MMMARILVVDDENLIRWSLGQSLRKHGYEVCCAADAAAATRAVQEGPFDLVISDVRLPDGDGVDLMKDLRPVQPEAKVVVITAYDMDDVRLRAEQLGVQAYVEKPFAVDAMVHLVETLTGPPESWDTE
jgi:DNA-binding NtrC family response regulator